MLVAALFAERHQPRAQGAVARRLGLGDWRQVGGLEHRTHLSSFPRKRESRFSNCKISWAPAFAGVTDWVTPQRAAPLRHRDRLKPPARPFRPPGGSRRGDDCPARRGVRAIRCVADHAERSAWRCRPRFRQCGGAHREQLSTPNDMLQRLKSMEREFGRRPGRRWGPRVLDLDIALWSGGAIRSRSLSIPHPQLARRSFVLQPLAAIAPGWRVGALNIRHLAHRLARRRRRG